MKRRLLATADSTVCPSSRANERRGTRRERERAKQSDTFVCIRRFLSVGLLIAEAAHVRSGSPVGFNQRCWWWWWPIRNNKASSEGASQLATPNFQKPKEPMGNETFLPRS
jgi:hypothetical protein